MKIIGKIIKVVTIISSFVMTYLYLIKPRLSKQKSTHIFKDHYYAHRGLHNLEKGIPENSLLAMKAAIDHGYGIEMDVQITKDDVLVVFHDETLERVCGVKGYLKDFTYLELQEFFLLGTTEQIPRFEEVLSLVGGRVPLIIELKMPTKDTHVCHIVNTHLKEYKGIFCIESFNPLALYWFKNKNPEIIRGQLSSNLNGEMGTFKIGYFVVEYLLTNVFTRPDFIAYNHVNKNHLSRRLCKELFRAFSVTWTIKTQEELEACRKDFDVFIFEGFLP